MSRPLSASNRPPKEQPKDWEDAYHRLKAQFEDLKVEYNEKERNNKL
jgi:hypothetical protein